MAKASKTVATRSQSTAVAKKALSFENDQRAGLENVTARDLLIPRLSILQSNSPQVLKARAEFIKGSEPGMICDVGTQELFTEGLHVIPVHFVKQWIEWAPRESKKGLIAIYDNDEIMDKTERDEVTGRAVLPNGNYIAETAQFFVLNLSARGRPSFIPMTSTQLKKARKWLTWADGERVEREDGSEFCPAFYYRSYLLGTVPESNAKGDFYGWTIERDKKLEELPSADNLYAAAKAFHTSISKGEVRGDVSSLREDAEAPHSDNERM